jgi:hypothetical protein
VSRTNTHPTWCARDHRCNLGEHRAQPITLTNPGTGVVVLTRVMDSQGREWVEVRTRIALARGHAARTHLARIVTDLTTHLRNAIAP